jgi:hypothetical protein
MQIKHLFSLPLLVSAFAGCASPPVTISPTETGVFPRGELNEAFAQYFTGTSYLYIFPLQELFASNVTLSAELRHL